MREIKFRAWFEASHMMEPFDFNSIYDDGYRDGEYGDDDGTVYLKPDVRVMQYTGLKDRNGVEIYEGDILKIDDPHVETYGEVVYWTESGRYFATFGIMGSGSFTNVMAYGNGRTLEVIGNIYENPELLEANQ